MDNLEEKIRLIVNVLGILADKNGDSKLEPLSLSLLCLEFDISWTEKEKIIDQFREISKQINENNLYEYSPAEIINLFRKSLCISIDKKGVFSDLIIYNFVRSVAKEYVDSLLPISSYLSMYFGVNSEIEIIEEK